MPEPAPTVSEPLSATDAAARASPPPPAPGEPTPPSREPGVSSVGDAVGEPVIDSVGDSVVEPVILYDGQCGLCHRSVRWLLARDRGRLRYAPLQGRTAATLRARFPAIPLTLESVVLVDGGRAYLRSKAFLHVTRYLTRPWRWAYALRWVPAAVLDPLYRIVARYRYRWFGHHDACQLPSARERQQLLP